VVLSQYARNVLAALADGPRSADDFNPGLRNRLQERGLVEIALLPHPKRDHNAPFLRLTEAGRAEVDRHRARMAR
jgi:hypothetical protein